MKKSCGILLLVTLPLPMAGMAEAYKCKGPDGKVTYSGQMSSTPGVQCDQMFVRKQPVAVPDLETAENAGQEAATPALPDAAAKTDQKTPLDKELEAKRKKAEADEAKIKADKAAADKLAQQKQREDNCAAAKSNLESYKLGRVQRVNEKGERYYLDDAALASGKAQAEKDIAENCK